VPLPEKPQVWPPAELANVTEYITLNDAWYTGDENALQMLYATTRQQSKTSMWGQVKRFFWGTPTPTTTSQQPTKIHVPLPAEIARMSASLLLEEMPKIQYPIDEDDVDPTEANTDTSSTAKAPETAESRANDRLGELLDDAAHARLFEGLEYSAAHGGSYVRVTWDTSPTSPVKDKPFLTTVPADGAVPEFRWGHLIAVTFWADLSKIEGQSGLYRLLERHEPGTIEWGLFYSQSSGDLGNRVPLSDHPSTEHLAAVVDERSQVATGSKLLTAAYLPNRTPNKSLRKDPFAKDLGASDFDGAYDLFDALDETETSYQRDIRLSKTRIMVPKGMLTSMGAGNGASFNADQEVFTELGTQVGSLNPGTGSGQAQGSAQSFIHTFQPVIRHAEHDAATTHLREQIYASCGYSAQSFGDAGDMAITATESVAREKLSILTRSAKVVVIRPRLAHLAAVLLDVDQHVFDGPGRPTEDDLPEVEFSDAAAVNPKVLAETLELYNRSESMSIQERVRRANEDWTKRQVADEVQRIKDDLSMLPDPTMAHLWMAEAGNASATGGVTASRSGVATDPAQTAAVTKATDTLNAQEAKLNGTGR
jgi:hypothetical protein